jgi:uncharacterized protein YfeS
MANQWDALADQLLVTLKSSVSDFIETEKPGLEDFLKQKAQHIAKMTWISLNGSDEEKAEAISNLRHLKAQVVMEAASLEIVATTAAVKLLGKVFEVVVNFALQYGVKLLAAI